MYFYRTSVANILSFNKDVLQNNEMLTIDAQRRMHSNLSRHVQKEGKKRNVCAGCDNRLDFAARKLVFLN